MVSNAAETRRPNALKERQLEMGVHVHQERFSGSDKVTHSTLLSIYPLTSPPATTLSAELLEIHAFPFVLFRPQKAHKLYYHHSFTLMTMIPVGRWPGGPRILMLYSKHPLVFNLLNHPFSFLIV